LIAAGSRASRALAASLNGRLGGGLGPGLGSGLGGRLASSLMGLCQKPVGHAKPAGQKQSQIMKKFQPNNNRHHITPFF
ncbi:MAG: hypothetical protein VXW11_06760, partial [Pseudomonadota bacterium]|nr:hypothetical protein [Pseudomonadota bacterium]